MENLDLSAGSTAWPRRRDGSHAPLAFLALGGRTSVCRRTHRMRQRLALFGPAPRSRRSCSRPYSRSTRSAALLDRHSSACRAEDRRRRDPIRSGCRALRTERWRSRYVLSVSRRCAEDLRVECRSRHAAGDAASSCRRRRFNFAIPEGRVYTAATAALARIGSRAARLPRAWVPGMSPASSTARPRPVRPQRHLAGKALRLRVFLLAAPPSLCPRSFSLRALDAPRSPGYCSRMSASRVDRSFPPWRGRACPRLRCRARPPALDPARHRRRGSRDLGRGRALPALSRPVRRGLRGTLVGVLRVRRHGVTT